MKALYSCDLHGRINLYEQMLAMAVRHDVRAVFIGGDLFPTRIPPPLTLICGGAEFQVDLEGQFRFLEERLAPLLLSFQASHPQIHLVYTPGNHDWIPAVKRFEDIVPSAVNVHGQTLSIDGITVFGYACVTDSTFWVKDYARRDRKDDPHVPSKFAIVSDADRLVQSPHGAYALNERSMEEELEGVFFPDPERTVCVFHCPPHDTGLDTLHDGRSIGSRSIRAFLEIAQPLVSLHGHIHESPYMSGLYQTLIGKTVAVNPGHSPKVLHAIVFDTDDPAETMVHSVFGRHVAHKGPRPRMPDRCMRKIKAFFMDRVLRGVKAETEGSFRRFECEVVLDSRDTGQAVQDRRSAGRRHRVHLNIFFKSQHFREGIDEASVEVAAGFLPDYFHGLGGLHG